MNQELQKMLRKFLSEFMPESERLNCKILIPQGMTRYQAMIFSLRQAGHDVSMFPETIDNE